MKRGQSVKLQGAEELEAVLTKMLRETEDLSDTWRDIYHPAILKGAQQFYDAEGDNKWPDLTSRYLFYKSKKGAGTRTLVGTPSRKSFPRIPGTLRDSITQEGHPLHILAINPRWLRTGTKDPLANIHFANKGRRKRKAIDAKSVSMQLAFREAVEQHAQAYGDMWGG